MIETLNQQNEQLKAEIKRKGTETSNMLVKMTENRDQPCKNCLLTQGEKERLQERLEDLEGRLNRESIDFKDNLSDL